MAQRRNSRPIRYRSITAAVAHFPFLLTGAYGRFEVTPTSCTVTLTPLHSNDVGGLPQRSTRNRATVGAELLSAMYGTGQQQSKDLITASLDKLSAANDAASVWTLPQDDRALVDINATDRKCRQSTYLELPPESIFESPSFNLHQNESTATTNVVDLGAGVGKVGATAVLIHGARRGVGVELSPTRFDAGCRALQRLSYWAYTTDSGTDKGSSSSSALFGGQPSPDPGIMQEFRKNITESVTIELVLGDILEYDNLKSAHRVVVFATCFPSQVTKALQMRMVEQLPQGARVFIVGTHTHGWSQRVTVERKRNPVENGDDVTYYNRSLEPLVADPECHSDAQDDNDIAKHIWILREDIIKQ